ncbi:ABC transporter ATP-binding protein [bacterium C-53]|nr:ABC transporter ATP-binding protein [Lachnospiraceae bacterium]NBI03760.1 ABC transporter ATP-binding protein [Lachnospiraceae bacterium]RKJ09180.1 ABC transporter ATP-binding protein [bacterium C-53]
MRSLFVYLRDYRKETVLAPLFKMLEASFELFVPLVMASMIDKGIGNGDISYIIKMSLILLLLAGIGLTSSITAQFFAAKAAVGFAEKLRSALFSHIQGFSFSEEDKLGTSTLITRMTSDINQVQNGVNMVLRLFLRSPFIVFGAMIMAFTIDVKAALIFVVTIPALSGIVFGIMMWTMPLYKKVQGKLDLVLRVTRENLTGARVIRAFAKEEEEKEHFHRENDELNTLQKYVGKISALMNPVTYIVVNAATIMLIYTGALRVDQGWITQGEVVALVNYMAQILVELVKLANLIVTITKALACADRVESVMLMESSMADGTLTESEIAGKTLHTKAAKVEFKNVCLTYQGAGGESLSGLNFRVERGDTTGIIGGTGSGKSSLVNLIPRFYDATKGEVLIDGVNVKDYPIETLRRKTGIVMQKAVLFKGSIRENICWGRKDATDEEIEEALCMSQSKEFVDQKEGRLDFFITQNGKNLSGGQKQRLSIARAMVRKPEILILDDSASALDFATDARLRKAIRETEGDMTVFIVSQRTSSIQHADQIIVLDDGEIAAIGTHEQLLKTCDLYQEIHYSQTGRSSEGGAGK